MSKTLIAQHQFLQKKASWLAWTFVTAQHTVHRKLVMRFQQQMSHCRKKAYFTQWQQIYHLEGHMRILGRRGEHQFVSRWIRRWIKYSKLQKTSHKKLKLIATKRRLLFLNNAYRLWRIETKKNVQLAKQEHRAVCLYNNSILQKSFHALVEAIRVRKHLNQALIRFQRRKFSEWKLNHQYALKQRYAHFAAIVHFDDRLKRRVFRHWLLYVRAWHKHMNHSKQIMLHIRNVRMHSSFRKLCKYTVWRRRRQR